MATLTIAHDGMKIRALRKSSGRTATEIARTIGVTPSTMSHIERNTRPASITVLTAIALALEVDLEKIVHNELDIDLDAISAPAAQAK